MSLESSDGYYKCYCQPGISGKRCEIVPEVAPTNATMTEESSSEGQASSETSSEQGSTTEPNNGENETE